MWCWRRLLRVPWTARRSNQSILKEISPGISKAEAEAPVLWPPHAKSWLIGKDSDARRDRGQEGKGTREDEMAGWHHWLNGRESEWTPGVGDGQGGLACCDSWGRKEFDTTEWLNRTEQNLLWSMTNIFMVIYLSVRESCQNGQIEALWGTAAGWDNQLGRRQLRGLS